jgi:hypothetical protein
MAEKKLESSVRKIEEYIIASEQSRNQEWRNTVANKLDEIEYHLAQQDEKMKKEKKISNGRMLLVAGLPVLAVGLGMFIYGALNIDRYFESYQVFSSSEIYMLIAGIIMVWVGFNWIKEQED